MFAMYLDSLADRSHYSGTDRQIGIHEREEKIQSVVNILLVIRQQQVCKNKKLGWLTRVFAHVQLVEQKITKRYVISRTIKKFTGYYHKKNVKKSGVKESNSLSPVQNLLFFQEISLKVRTRLKNYQGQHHNMQTSLLLYIL